ncbi:formate/nitrite transporter family protein [Citroniella saccharovorans]|uniref:Formate/nitrite transporter family protein n=1 Tax=Citroniella saccharovorans TaxID=2053367 RepID=A0AAW9MYU7_9FIRM|nr:formate/nitrite transporter family protein [Citroniella saccharovorans]MEB3429750.1 formate/nitrite transporter family protein [Citroniella saccharovorans]
MKKFTNFLLAIMAGAFIAIGGIIYLLLENKIIGSLLFSTGLYAVLTLGLNLFTGKVGYLFQNKAKTYIPFLVIVYLGNLVGSVLVAELIKLTRASQAIVEAATKTSQLKIGDNYLSLFVLGIFCNLLVVHAVYQYNSNKHEIGKYIGIVLSIMVFILCGFEHSIADMFYFHAAGMLFTAKGLTSLLVITLGNIVGGVIIPCLMAFKEKNLSR